MDQIGPFDPNFFYYYTGRYYADGFPVIVNLTEESDHGALADRADTIISDVYDVENDMDNAIDNEVDIEYEIEEGTNYVIDDVDDEDEIDTQQAFDPEM
ncbi:hypothetical protein Droror1_Dr00008469, partial [Drosera rotundifolia]